MKILIATNNASSEFGGEAVLPLHYFRYLVKRKIDVWMVVHERCRAELGKCLGSDIDKVYFITDTAIMKVLFTISRCVPLRFVSLISDVLLGLIVQILQRRLIKKLVKEHDIDIVHQPNPVSPKQPSLFFALGAQVVIGPMNGGMSYPKGFHYMQGRGELILTYITRVASHFINLLIPGKFFADRLLVANERTLKALPAFRLGKSELLVENGVDLTVFNNNGYGHRSESSEVLSKYVKLPLDYNNNRLKLVYVGRLVDWKCVDILIDAVADIRDNVSIELHIIGDGDERESLEHNVSTRGVGNIVFFYGQLKQEECPKVLQAMDVFILPSLYECGGAVVLEAMSLELPVIATKWGGPVDYIDDSCGILVDPTGGRAIFTKRLSEAIIRLSKNTQLRRSLGYCGRKKVEEEFDWEKKVDCITKVYQDVLREYSENHAVTVGK